MFYPFTDALTYDDKLKVYLQKNYIYSSTKFDILYVNFNYKFA